MTNAFDNLNDDLDAAAPRTTRETLTATRDAQGFIAPAAPAFEQRCAKCRGTGRFTSYSGRVLGECFTCKGAGKLTFKTAPEVRAKGRARAAVKAEQKAVDKQAAIEAFRVEQPAVWAWFQENDRSDRPFEFATELYAKLLQYGSLNENQIGGCLRCIAARDAKRAERKAAAEATAPAVDAAGIDRLKTAFDTALADANERGLNLEKIKLTFGNIAVKPAKANSRNPGGLYAYENRAYVGKIVDGRFFATRECSQGTTDTVLKLIADPEGTAKAYGQTTGTCCVCNATLRSDWKYKGIGPICAEKYGWA